MDLINLTINLEKEPSAYRDEYIKQIESLKALINLHRQPEKLIRQTLAFLMKFPTISPVLPQIVVESLHKIRSTKLKKVVINDLYTLCYKNLLSLDVVIRSIIVNSSDVTSLINKSKGLILSRFKNGTEDGLDKTKGVLIQYFQNGTEKQKCFCYYFIVNLFVEGHTDLESYVCAGIFEDSKVRRICHSYFLELIDGINVIDKLSEESRSTGTKLYKEIMEKKDERENKIMKMRIYVLFRNRYCLKGSIISLALSMLDASRIDAKELMQIVVDSVNQKEVIDVIEVVTKHFCSPFKDDDMICYGLNILREIYLKFAVDDEGGESHDKQVFTDTLKDTILNYVECFDKSKIKCVNYAYRSVMNAVNKKEGSNRAIDFVLRRSVENKDEEVQPQMTKAEKKELCSRKGNRKFKLSKKKIRSNLMKKKR